MVFFLHSSMPIRSDLVRMIFGIEISHFLHVRIEIGYTSYLRYIQPDKYCS